MGVIWITSQTYFSCIYSGLKYRFSRSPHFWESQIMYFFHSGRRKRKLIISSKSVNKPLYLYHRSLYFEAWALYDRHVDWKSELSTLYDVIGPATHKRAWLLSTINSTPSLAQIRKRNLQPRDQQRCSIWLSCCELRNVQFPPRIDIHDLVVRFERNEPWTKTGIYLEQIKLILYLLAVKD